MVRPLTFAVGFAAGYGLRAAAGKQPFAPLHAALGRTSSRLLDVPQWAAGLSSAASASAGSARSALRRAGAAVGATQGPHDPTSGGVIPLGAVPIDQLSDWELDLLTTPDSSR